MEKFKETNGMEIFFLQKILFQSSSSSVVGPDDRYDFSEVISGP